MLMISGLHTATGQTYVTYGLYGKYDEDPKSYFLRVQFNFIDVDAPNEDAAWWEVGGYVLADEAQKGLDNLNQAFNPHGIFFLADEPTPDCASPATYRTYFDLQKGKTKVFKIQLNASFLGRYYLPIANCEAMYDNSVNAKDGGRWVEVVKSSAE